MIKVQTGQCGICVHFGERHQETAELQHIRTTSRASEVYTDECGHPVLAQMRLRVTPISGCKGFEATQQAPSERARPEASQ
jgi:hypothetical protein